jgi:regulator of chromosome condensation
VWGLNNYGQLATGDTNSPYFPKKSQALSDLNADTEQSICIASGQHHSIFSTVDGKVYSVGRADYGRLGLGEGATHQELPAEVGALSDHKVQQVSCGEVVSFAVTDEGHLYSWGMGSCLQLGKGDDDDVMSPILVEGKNLVAAEHEVLNVEAGGQHTVILARKKS